ncbi:MULTISPECIES: hypothetical protein [unclassified Rathayibacter]|uniref:hypothetical protein n=1 Tax=unclassified Rathayibacter TaxID=2609250 RepID=UPI0011B07A65|nr:MULTISPECIES: hypothetical protein [unclassified Rathayibacter]
MTQAEHTADAFLRGVRVFLKQDRAGDIELIHCWAQEPNDAFILYRYRRGPSNVFGWHEQLLTSEGVEVALLHGMDTAQELSEPVGTASIKADGNGIKWVGQAIHTSQPKLTFEAVTLLRSAMER